MKKALLIAAILSGSAALAACDRAADDPASMTSEPGGSVTMPSPAPENNLGSTPPAEPGGTMGGTTGGTTAP